MLSGFGNVYINKQPLRDQLTQENLIKSPINQTDHKSYAHLRGKNQDKADTTTKLFTLLLPAVSRTAKNL